MPLSRRTVNVLTLIIVLILLAFIGMFMASERSINQAKQETVRLVEVDHDVKKVNKFYWLTTTEATYFSLDYQNEENKQSYAIVARDGGDVHYFSPQDIISEADAKAITVANNEDNLKDIVAARLGLLDGQPVWEITFKTKEATMTYYYINAKNGQNIQVISNL